MTSNQEINLEQVASDVRDIRHALLGNPLLSDGGLVGRVVIIEEKVESITLQQSNWKSFLAGVAFVIGLAGSLFGWFIGTVWTKHSS